MGPPEPVPRGTMQPVGESTSALRVGHVYFDVRRKRLLWLNATARQLHDEGIPFVPSDLSRSQLLGIGGEPVTASELPLIIAWRQKKMVEAEFRFPRAQGRAWPIRWTATPLRSVGGHMLGVIGSVSCGPPEPDPLKLAELAHDLRTPLQSLRLLTAYIDRLPKADSEVTAVVQSMKAAAERAIQIALELLECFRGPAAQTSLRAPTWFGLEELLQGLASEQTALAEQKGLQLGTNLTLVRGWEAHTDRGKLGRVLSNLLVNAVRYTSTGRIDFSVDWREGPDGKFLVLSVHDTGPGISQEEHESIFHPFERGKAGRESDSGGSGLGLSVVDRLVEELGLTLEVQSEYGRGTAFHLLIPAAMLRQTPATSG